MRVDLTSPFDEYVLSKVRTGQYSSASEVILDALRKMQDAEARQESNSIPLSQDELEDVRAGVREGIAGIERGEGMEYEGDAGLKQLFAELRAEARAELLLERRPGKAR